MAVNEVQFEIWMGEFTDLAPGQNAPIPIAPNARKLYLSDDWKRGYGIVGEKIHLYNVKIDGNALRCTHLGTTSREEDAKRFLGGTPKEEIEPIESGSGKNFFATILKFGPQIVRSWFDTVVNPIIHSLKSEQELLERKNYTWQFRPGQLEAIRPIRE